jgi:hypothetical protein
MPIWATAAITISFDLHQTKERKKQETVSIISLTRCHTDIITSSAIQMSIQSQSINHHPTTSHANCICCCFTGLPFLFAPIWICVNNIQLSTLTVMMSSSCRDHDRSISSKTIAAARNGHENLNRFQRQVDRSLMQMGLWLESSVCQRKSFDGQIWSFDTLSLPPLHSFASIMTRWWSL